MKVLSGGTPRDPLSSKYYYVFRFGILILNLTSLTSANEEKTNPGK
jgi:hypothetical protein